MTRTRLSRLAAAGLFALVASAPLAAEKQFTGPGLARREAQPGALNAQAIQERVGFDQKLASQVPLDLAFVDEAGRAVTLGGYFGERPVLLVPAYYRCPTLCIQTSIGVAAAMKAIPYAAGRDFEVVFFSIDPTDMPETAAEKKAAMIARFGDPAAAPGVHFLTGGANEVAALAAAIGFRYAYDETNRQYAHAAGVVALTPDGRTSRYIYGVEIEPRDLKLALFEAGEGKIGGLSERLMLLCFDYNAALGRYTAATMISLKAAATLTILALAASIIWMLRVERRNRRQDPPRQNPRSGDASIEGAASV